MAREHTSVARALIVFTLSSLLVLIVVAAAGVMVLRRVATAQAEEDAERVAVVAARGIVEPRLLDGIAKSGVQAILRIDALAYGGLLRGPIEAFQIVDGEGVVRYADVPELIGTSAELDTAEIAGLRDAEVATSPGATGPPAGLASSATSTAPSFGAADPASEDAAPLLLVSVPVTTPNGTPLLARVWIRPDPVDENVADLWPLLAVALIALALLQMPFAYRLARSVRASEEERERLLRRAIESSDVERRRIAADLHDGTIQQLAGVSMALSAKADSAAAESPDAAASLREAATTTRGAIRSLRSAVMGIAPPRLQGAGLAAALSDLVEPVADRTELVVPSDLLLPPEVESLLFRAAQEAMRNVVAHSGADHVRLVVASDGRRATLEVDDDGVGFSPEDQRRAGEDGHVGLHLLEDLARDADGTLDVSSAPGQGTKVHLEVPLSR
ncbi:MAG: sensor histidine kinase [Actinomycetota bacterium]